MLVSNVHAHHQHGCADWDRTQKIVSAQDIDWKVVTRPDYYSQYYLVAIEYL